MIIFENVIKNYGETSALRNINLHVNEGEFICVIGTSGSGKTTLMRMINRMVNPTSGSISINGEDIQNYDEVNLRRKIGYVIQNIGLFPHMTIRENIMLVPNLLKWSEQKKHGVAEDLMKQIELPMEYLDKKPSHLSGGQQQRIGVIRALAANQSILLMDEPFGALDTITREALQTLIKKLQKKMNKTIVFVTHDIEEALKLADRILIMNNSEVVQFSNSSDILSHPANDFVKKLIGQNQKQNLTNNCDNISQSNVPKIVINNSFTTIMAEVKKKVTHDQLLLDKTILEETIFTIIDFNITDSNERNEIKQALSKLITEEYKYIPVEDNQNNLVGVITKDSLVGITYKQIR